jgi:hypothetical protein
MATSIERAQERRADLTKRIGMLRFRLAHPERYVISGKYTREQKASLRTQLDAAVEARAELDLKTKAPKRAASKRPSTPRLGAARAGRQKVAA